ncbi:recombinase family protein [Paracoccus seriniphilus]|uniref:Recombinase n=1 Tax=Paracoccus seriniphilus TaxID=184748 RepID=A0A239Q2X4_9RHOB|nr:recombinase family protein [Paracoccus seriniphilus]WCR12756.1 recombinase family protein [Paracoccus seriniphilus]SNT76800.1 Recombinase [Paracoccus seriniphilus]
MGGYVPLGYDVVDRKLIVNEAEAAQIRTMFELFARSDSTAAVIRELNARGTRSKRSRPIDHGALYKLLHDRIYRGEITHKGET